MVQQEFFFTSSSLWTYLRRRATRSILNRASSLVSLEKSGSYQDGWSCMQTENFSKFKITNYCIPEKSPYTLPLEQSCDKFH